MDNVGSMNSAIVRGPARNNCVPSASSPVTCSALGPIAATYSGIGVPPGTRTGRSGAAVSWLPWKSTEPSSSTERRTVRYSRSRCNVFAGEMPNALRSNSCPPSARPRLKFPCAAACAVCANDATISGCRGLIGIEDVPTPSPGTAAPISAASAMESTSNSCPSQTCCTPLLWARLAWSMTSSTALVACGLGKTTTPVGIKRPTRARPNSIPIDSR